MNITAGMLKKALVDLHERRVLDNSPSSETVRLWLDQQTKPKVEKLSKQAIQSLKDEQVFMEALRSLGGEANTVEIRHAHMHWMTSSQVGLVGKRLEKKGFVEKVLVKAPHLGNGVKGLSASRGEEPSVSVWHLPQEKTQ